MKRIVVVVIIIIIIIIKVKHEGVWGSGDISP
jgi:hypothetical protein